MNTFKKILITLGLIAGLSVTATAQIALSTTTLGAAVGVTANIPATRVTFASTSTFQNRGTQNQFNTIVYVDKEQMCVVTVVSSTVADVQRGCGVGAAGVITTHASGAFVYFANTTTANGPGGPTMAASQFNGAQQTAELYGSCSRSSIIALPVIYTMSGDVFDCKRTGAAGTAGQWIRITNGSMGQSGSRISAFCTGTVGSAESDFLNGAACSSATTATARQVINNYGNLANLRVFSSAAFLGTGSTATTVYKNGSATAITCSATAAATTCSDLIHSVQVAPGDVITFLNVSATSDTAANISASVGLY